MYETFIKRVIDLFISLLAFIIFLPAFIPVSIILLLTGEHRVWYFQKRIGYKNRSFYIWKFATMLKDSPNMGTGSLTLRNDPRVTAIGKILRKTKINELPQIFNVLLGNMSIVGPRPQMEVDFLKFPKNIQKQIYNAKPGITGIGSIVFRDEELLISKNSEMDPHEYYQKYIAPYKGEIEVWYQNHISFYTDMMIIFLTAWIIFRPKSNLPYKIFKDLPQKPQHLKL